MTYDKINVLLCESIMTRIKRTWNTYFTTNCSSYLPTPTEERANSWAYMQQHKHDNIEPWWKHNIIYELKVYMIPQRAPKSTNERTFRTLNLARKGFIIPSYQLPYNLSTGIEVHAWARGTNWYMYTPPAIWHWWPRMRMESYLRRRRTPAEAKLILLLACPLCLASNRGVFTDDT